MFEKDLSVFGERDSTPLSLEQDEAQFFLQIGDGAAQRRLGDVQVRGGKPEMLISGYCLKVSELV